MRNQPLALRRALAVGLLLLPVLLARSPWGLRLAFPLAFFGVLFALLVWLGLGEDLAERLLFLLLAPFSWLATRPERWWTALARWPWLPSELVLGALQRGEAWGEAEATYELALEDLGSGLQGLAEGGVRRLRPLAEGGHRRAQAALAGALWWGQGIQRDARAAERWWIRSGGAAGVAIPAPPPSLLRARTRRDATIPAALGQGLAGGAEEVGRFLARHAPVRWALFLLAAGIVLLLLAVPITMMLGFLQFAGPAGEAFRWVGLAYLCTVLPFLATLALLAFQLRGPRAGLRAFHRRLARAHSGDAQAAFDLGLAFEQGGIHTPKDLAEARRWYGLAAEQGHAEAAFRLGELLLLGLGGMKDRPGGRAWLQRAADQGHAGAEAALANAAPESTDPAL